MNRKVLLESEGRAAQTERFAEDHGCDQLNVRVQIAAWIFDGFTGRAVAAAALRRNVEMTPLSVYWQGKVLQVGLHLGFAAVDVKEIRRGVKELAIALEEVGKVAGGPSELRQRNDGA